MIWPLILWVEDRDLREHSHHSRAANAAVCLLIHTGTCVPESPCVNTKVESCFTKLHQHALFDLQTTHTINDFFLPHQPCSLILLPCQSLHSFPSFLHLSFPVFSPLSHCSPHSSFHLLFSLSSSLLPLHVISFISFVFLPPDLPLHTPLPSLCLPSLSVSLAGCSLQWVSIMEAGSGAAAAVGSAALGLLGATATSSHDILDR